MGWWEGFHFFKISESRREMTRDKCRSAFAYRYEPVEGDEWLPIVTIVVAWQTNFFKSAPRGRRRIALKCALLCTKWSHDHVSAEEAKIRWACREHLRLFSCVRMKCRVQCCPRHYSVSRCSLIHALNPTGGMLNLP